MAQGIKSYKIGDVIGTIELIEYLGKSRWKFLCRNCGYIGSYGIVNLKNKEYLNIKDKCTCPKKIKKIGNLDVLSLSLEKTILKCTCGKEIVGNLEQLKKEYKSRKSCGCLSNKLIDRKNCRYGHLTALNYLGNKMWECLCDCNNIVAISTRELRRGRKYCGINCILNPSRATTVKPFKLYVNNKNNNDKENIRSKESTHPNLKRAKRIYLAMLSRENKKPNYENILVCPEWKNSFEKFIEDMGIPISSKYSIDRIDNLKGYFKDNCRWATNSEQQRNKKGSIYVEIRKEVKPLAEWCEQYNLKYQKVYEYYYRKGIDAMINKYFSV